jgi:transposase-like protein
MYYTEARDMHYKAGVPRDLQTFFARLGGIECPNCGAHAGFSTLNEQRNWTDNQNPFRCAVCQYEWQDV